MKPEKTWNDAMDSLCQIMLNEWSKEEIIEYIRSRDGYTKNDMTSLPIKEFKCKDVYGQEYVLSYTDAPMVEYAPIVRCKDCLWRGDDEYCDKHGFQNATDEFFCASGRKEQEDEQIDTNRECEQGHTKSI